MVTEVRCNSRACLLLFQINMNLKPLGHHRESHRTVLVANANANRRRSSRMTLNAHIELSGEDRQKCSFTMSARATNLNRHGASVQLNRELLVGSVVLVKNKRGAQVSARVVAQLAALHGVSTYAIEFVEKDDCAKNFWGISFPSTA